MSKVNGANGGDGWSAWHVKLLITGAYKVRVTSNLEFTADGAPKVVHLSEDIRDGRQAIDKAISESSSYAHRMYT